MEWIPDFPITDAELTALAPRADGWWGVHEYALWPQSYHESLLHHACIPRWPALGKGEAENPPSTSMLWYTLTESDWIPSTNASIGQIKPSLNKALAIEAEIVIAQAYRGIHANDPYYVLLHYLTELVRLAVDRLKLTEPRRVLFTTVREIQRISLEIIGFDNYTRIIKPRLESLNPSERSPFNFRGVFVRETSLAQQLFRVGIPVWIVRHIATIDRNTRVERQVNRLHWDHYFAGQLMTLPNGLPWIPENPKARLRTMNADARIDKKIIAVIDDLVDIGLDRDSYQTSMKNAIEGGNLVTKGLAHSSVKLLVPPQIFFFG